ncbi:MAG: ABC transporter ATP-binding protein [Gammaproteobacteria bacterium]|nr:ABC transporter ATP-binding protein [Gammaproteobacteria bacterium]MCY4219100.1 ABC transporter ATP-binding protein [Gammaproteobacteria bacterium]
MNVLEIQNLNVTFATEGSTLRALKNVSIDIPKRCIVGVVGESGCGKSTLINSILRLLPENGKIDAGTIKFEGHDLTKFDLSQMKTVRGSRISTVFQDPMSALNPVLSIADQMLHIQYRSKLRRKEKQEKSIEMLRRVRIPDPESALKRYPHEFSGGMKQRISIAMAMMMEPALLIADEPTTALDATLEVAIIDLLKELQSQIECSILFISHHLGLIAELCDQVIVMYAGEVLERGTAHQIFHDPWHPYSARLLECDPANQTSRTRQLPTIPGEIPDLKAIHKGCIFRSRCQYCEDICTTVPEEFGINGHFVRCHRKSQ